MEMTYLTAFVVGLLGGTHCLGMCGGIVSGLTMGMPTRYQQTYARMMPFHLLYNSGRITSYVILGAGLGAFGAWLGSLTDLAAWQAYLGLLAGAFMIVLGLYLGQWWFGLVQLEKVGEKLWQYIEPTAKKLLPVKTHAQAYRMGLVWGLIPCGLVYSVLMWSMASGSAMNGALLMLAFGLGTLPNLMLMGVFAFWFTRLTKNVWVRRVAGLTVMAFGVVMIVDNASFL